MKKLALITGSTGGLGVCFAEIHASNHNDVILVSRDEAKLLKQKNELESKYKIKAYILAIDLSQSAAAKVIYEFCINNNLDVEYLINNAGFGGQGEFIKRSIEDDLSMISVNIETPTKLCKLFINDFVKKGHGKVLNVSSTAALMPGPLQAVYYATKSYLTSLSNALSRELKGTGVSVTCLMPGAMSTGFGKASGMDGTKAFKKLVKPNKVAEKGYKGMIKGKLNVIAGLPLSQRIFVPFMPLMPKKMILNMAYNLQKK